MSTKIPSAIRNTVWNYYIGPDMKSGNCSCCKLEKISYVNFECGHVIAYSKGGETNIENLRPICSNCNKSMGTTCMTDFMEKYGLDKIKAKPISKDKTNEKKTNNKKNKKAPKRKRKVNNNEKIREKIEEKIKKLDGFNKFKLFGLLSSVDDIYTIVINDSQSRRIENKNENFDNFVFDHPYLARNQLLKYKHKINEDIIFKILDHKGVNFSLAFNSNINDLYEQLLHLIDKNDVKIYKSFLLQFKNNILEIFTKDELIYIANCGNIKLNKKMTRKIMMDNLI